MANRGSTEHVIMSQCAGLNVLHFRLENVYSRTSVHVRLSVDIAYETYTLFYRTFHVRFHRQNNSDYTPHRWCIKSKFSTGCADWGTRVQRYIKLALGMACIIVVFNASIYRKRYEVRSHKFAYGLYLVKRYLLNTRTCDIRILF